MTLTAKQQTFVDAHAGSTKEAAAVAGLSQGYCRRLMMDVTNRNAEPAAMEVQAKIRAKQAKMAQKLAITEEDQIRRFQELSRGAEDCKQFSSSVSAEDKITTILGLYERDNKQKTGKTVVEILAIVGNARRKAIGSSEPPVEALTSGEGTIESIKDDGGAGVDIGAM